MSSNVSYKVLAKAVAASVPREGIFALELPAAVPDAFADAVVADLNVRKQAGGHPYSVRVVPNSVGAVVPPRVNVGAAEEYRTGDRVFVYRHGEYDPYSSTSSTVRRWFGANFPSSSGDSLTIALLSRHIADVLHPVTGGEVQVEELEEAIEKACEGYRTCLEGNGGERSWTEAWWSALGQFADRLPVVLPVLLGEGTPLKVAVMATASLTQAFLEGPSSVARAASDLVSLAAQVAAADQREVVESRIREHDPKSRLLDLQLAEVEAAVVSGEQPITGLIGARPTGVGVEDGAIDRARAWMSVDEEVVQAAIGAKVIPFDVTLKIADKTLRRIGTDGAYLVSGVTAQWKNSGEAWSSALDLEIELRPSTSLVQATGTTTIGLRPQRLGKEQGAAWTCDGARLRFSGILALSHRRATSWLSKPVTIAISVPAAYHATFGTAVAVEVFFGAPQAHTLVAADKGGKLVATSILSAIADASTGDAVECRLSKPQLDAAVIVLESPVSPDRAPAAVTLSEHPLEPAEDGSWILTAVDLTDGLSLEVFDAQGQVRAAATFVVERKGLNAEWLPIAAAIRGLPPNREPAVPKDLEDDIRGELETDLLKRIAGWKGGSGAPPLHGWVMQAGVEEHIPLSEPDENGMVWAGRPGGVGDISLQELAALREFPQYEAFSDALYALLSAISSNEPGVTTSLWTSRWSLAKVDPGVVDAYLAAWTSLVEVAKPKQKIWALFPFTLLLVDGPGRLRGALLSPLHPLRVGWLHSIERAARELSDTMSGGLPRLLQLVEGWNFPYVTGDVWRLGQFVKFLAVPLWPGEHRLFLGWSALASVDSGSPGLPERASGRRVPSGGSSGLTASAVATAVGDYLKVHPYLTTLTLELHAATAVARSWELDDAVVDEVAGRGADEVTGIGLKFIKVIESPNLTGDPPRAGEVLARASERGDGRVLPFSWTRAPAENGAALVPVDVRLVEDSHSTVAVGQDASELGTLGRLPFRRIGVRERSDERGVVLHTAPRGSLDAPYARALRAFERVGSQAATIVVEASAFGLGIQTSARWVVTGSSLLDPASLGPAMHDGQLLWEWRPAAAARPGDDLPLSRRPYLTIARVPAALLDSLQEFEGVSSEAVAKEILSELGRRGVGLASLVGLGGHHAEGAIGFYLAFRMISASLRVLRTDGKEWLVLPLDAIHGLLESVARRDEVEKLEERADLLVLAIEAPPDGIPSITFLPVEIRCSNMRLSDHTATFPGFFSKAVRDKVGQLESTVRLLQAIKRRAGSSGRDGPTTALRELSRTAIAALVEAGIAMIGVSLDPLMQSRVLGGLCGDECEIRVASGVLLWFQKDMSLDGFASGEVEGHSVLMVNPMTTRYGDWGASSPDPAVSTLQSLLQAHVADARTMEGEDIESLARVQVRSSSGTGDELASARGQPQPSAPAANDVAPQISQTFSSGVGGDTHGKASRTPAASAGAPPVDEHAREIDIAASPSTTTDLPRSDAAEIAPGVAGRAESPSEEQQALIGVDAAGRPVYWRPMHPSAPLTNAHMVIVGSAGSGKTSTIKAIVTDMTRTGIPALVLDFKDDYKDERTLSCFSATLWDVRKGLPYNPLAVLPDGLPVLDIIYGLNGILSAVYRLGDQQSATLRSALREVYEQRGYTAVEAGVAGDSRKAPTLLDLRDALESRPGTALILNRLGALFDFDLFRPEMSGMAALLRGPAVVRFTSLPQEELKAATAALFLRALYLHLQQVGHSGGKLRLLLVIDEAHRVANLAEVQLLVREARAYGVGVILSTQEPSDLDSFAFTNAETIMSLKIASATEADRIARMLAPNQAEVVAMADRIRALPQFGAMIRNAHYMPYRAVSVVPFHLRPGY